MSPEQQPNNAPTSISQKPTAENMVQLLWNENACFHSEVDRKIATDFLIRIHERLVRGVINQETYSKAIDGLNFLIPKQNERGLRVIGDIILTPGRERLIRSRIEAKEVDITAPTGSWGSLPEVVKREIAGVSNFFIEMTDGCTNGCSFCFIAKKRPIREKMSFSGLERLLTFIKEYGKLPGHFRTLDHHYWGSDPFDAKWVVGGQEYDYLDFAKRYWSIIGIRKSALFVSTAIPIGEEFRVLRFADFLVNMYRQKLLTDYNCLRISLTNANKLRVEAIVRILEASIDNFSANPSTGSDISQIIEISENRDTNPRRMGSMWRSDLQKVNLNNIIPLCSDTMTIHCHSITGNIMQAASNERPDGFLYVPIMKTEYSGKRKIYTIVHSRDRVPSEKHFDLINYVDQTYPNPQITTIVEEGLNISKDVRTISDDPHRALLRLLDAYLCEFAGVWFPGEKRSFRKKLHNEFEVIEKHVATGAINKSIDYFMYFFNNNKRIE